MASLLPAVRFAYYGPVLHVVLETAEALIAALAGYLLFGRFRATRLRADLLLVGVLTTLALTNLVLVAVPTAVTFLAGEGFTDWAPLLARLFAAGMLASAALLSGRSRLPVRRAGWLVLVGCAVVLVLIGTVVAALGSSLPSLVTQSVTPEASARPLLTSHPVVLVAQLATMGCYAVAAVYYTKRAAAEASELLTWLAAGCALAVFARANYALFPSLYSQWVYLGDVLRLGFYLALLVGCSREIRRYWQRVADAAVAEERRRIARDLHDGLAQELTFIATSSTRLPRLGGGHGLVEVAAAAQRALDESRRAIAVLTAEREETLEEVIVQAAEQVAGRSGLQVSLDLQDGVEVAPAVREELGRIVREAMMNAARHSSAETVSVQLRSDPGLRLQVRDGGVGFDPAATGPKATGGFGLVSMRERAQALGGTLQVDSAPGRGTRVEVTLP